jgi:hyaluronan synthase
MTELLIYPLLGIALAIVGAATIKLCFHRNKAVVNDLNNTNKDRLTATYIRGRSVFLVLILITFLAWIAWQFSSIYRGYAPELRPLYIVFGLVALTQFLIAATIRPHRIKTSIETNDLFKTAIIVPVYNESEYSLRQGLESFFQQTHLPNEIHVVDDGSRHHYTKTQKWLRTEAKKYNVVSSWERLETNKGKRHAHSKAIESITHKENMIIITVDSDGILDSAAIDEGLKPFHDPQIKSVAGVVIAKNAQVNLLSRITDLIFVSNQQLIDRAAMSHFGNVLVNSGGLAFYRSDIVHQALEQGYTRELFFGRPVSFSDDSFLTLFALLQGKTVQQPSAIVFADMPIKLGHHFRQQIRWGRGSFIRSWWRLRHLPINSVGYIRQLLGWILFLALTITLIELLLVIPITQKVLPPIELVIIPIIFSYIQASRYFVIKRSDMSRLSQTFTYLLAPVAIVWSMIVLRIIRLYAIVTCLRTGWGTRRQVEILHPTDDHA